MRPLITALVDTYNHEKYIEQALVSVLEQGLSPTELEIVVVDDGSTDNTPSIIQKFAPRVKLVRKKNGGQATAFNAGFAEARGDIVALLDADDYWLPGKLRRVMDEFEKNPSVGTVHHRLREMNEITGEIHDSVFSAISGDIANDRKLILSFTPTPTSSLAFRREVLQKILPIPEGIWIQADGYMQALAPLLAAVIGIDEPLAVYRIHGGNLYFLSQTERDAKRRELRAATLVAIVEGLWEWFAMHGYKAGDPIVKATVNRWVLLLKREEFAINSPGRLEFLLHLLKCYRHNHCLFGWRIRLMNYWEAVAALILGYTRFQKFAEKRGKLKRSGR
jgi:glycosyltransferase involved in cell wall biosynthesis